MCDRCVIETVKDRMLTRRGFFGTTAAATAGLAMASAVAPPALADGHSRVLDMTHSYNATFPTFSGTPGIAMEQAYALQNDGYNLFNLTLDEHTGTHIDAPLHFSADGHSVDEIPVADLVCPLVAIDISARATDNPDTQVTPDDLTAWIATHGPIPDGACVAMHSGWATKVGTDAFRNAGADGTMHFPGFHVEAAEMLLTETKTAAIAVDTLSLDHGSSADFATHYAWLPANRYGIECLAGLDRVPASGATLIVGAPTHRGGSGGPARIFAMV